MSSMKRGAITAGLIGLFVVLLTIVSSSLPSHVNQALTGSVFAAIMLVTKAAWTIGLVYVGVRLALRHERQVSH
jgi:hypothetical protein